MSEKEIKLEPCPFCGDSDSLVEEGYDLEFIACSHCEVSTHKSIWNTRPRPSVEEVEKTVQNVLEESVRKRDECDKYVPRWYLMEGRKEACIKIKVALSRLRREAP